MFEDFYKFIATRDLFESGAISFAGVNFSHVAEHSKELTKFNMIDNGDDRVRMAKFVKALQFYLNNPEAEKFVKLFTKEELAPSTRNARNFALLEFALKGHVDVVTHVKKESFNEANITNLEVESMVDGLVQDGFLLKPQGENFKKKNLGWGKLGGTALQRRLRTWLWEDERKDWQLEGKWYFFKILALLLNPLWELVKGAGAEAKKQ